MSRATRKTNNLEADVVVIGSGGGLAAAVAAREMGASVILLEKENILGGYTRQANGLMACESPVQKRMNITVTSDEVFRRFLNWNHWYRVNPRVVRAYLNKTGDTIRWLEEKGVKFIVQPLSALRPGQLPIGHMPVGMGAGVQKALIKSCQALGVTALLNTSGKRIVIGAKGNVTGVVAVTKDGEEFEIKTKSAIIATGGFGDNRELLKKHCPDYYDGMPLDPWPHHAAHSGDGLLMAQEIGAAVSYDVPIYHLGAYYPEYPYPYQSMAAMIMNNYSVWVNKRGRRFTDETTTTGMMANPIIMQPDKVIYSIFDDEMRRRVEEGLDDPGGRRHSKPGGGTVVTKKGFPGLKEELRKQAELGETKIADSWDEIARWMGAKPEVLKAEVDEYNSCCEKGRDAIFAKDPKFLRPLRRPPYYAMRCYDRVGETLGGIIVNERMAVLTPKDEPIPGAYVAGVLADGIQGQTYCYDVGGSAMGFAVNSGRIAGENAARFALKKGKP
jgi:fumarate reductase flavoprotein subunit